MYPVLILAGGLATRLRPVTETIPKSLVEINGEPFVFHQLRLLKSKGVDEVVFCTGYLGEMIEDAVGDGSVFGIRIRYSNDGTELLGTGGAVKKALPMFEDAFFITYGDSYLDCNYLELEKIFTNASFPAVMTIYKNDDSWDTSNVEYNEKEKKIVIYSKTQKTLAMRYIDYGLSIVNKKIFNDFSEQQIFDLSSLFEKLSKEGILGAFKASHRFYEIGSFNGIKELSQNLKTQ